MMRFFGLKTCDTCRKSLSSLRAAGHAPTVIDVREDGLSSDVIAAIVQVFGDGAVNRSSATWRNLDDRERAAAVPDLLSRHPTLLKRPVIEVDGQWTQGWDRTVQARYLG